jgi:DNA-binding transcriptional LysR family regulator
MWNAEMIAALRTARVDVAISLCPEPAPELADELIRTEQVVALLPASHPLARAQAIPLSSLADETFLVFPRELAPRLHDVLLGACRGAGFEPKLRSESFHTGWDLLILADAPVVALAPRSVANELPEGVVALPLGEPTGRLETRLVWRDDDSSPIVEAFRSAAQAVFDRNEQPMGGAEPG